MNTTNYIDKYSVIPLNSLIRTVQETSVKMLDPEFKKETGSTKMMRMVKDIREMQMSCQARLVKMDRNDPKFFPLDSYIDYRDPNLPMKEIQGRVIGYSDDGKVIIDILKYPDPIAVWPQYLKLKFIKINY